METGFCTAVAQNPYSGMLIQDGSLNHLQRKERPCLLKMKTTFLVFLGKGEKTTMPRGVLEDPSMLMEPHLRRINLDRL